MDIIVIDEQPKIISKRDAINWIVIFFRHAKYCKNDIQKKNKLRNGNTPVYAFLLHHRVLKAQQARRR